MRKSWLWLCALALSLSAQAGVLDDLKESASGVRDTIRDVKSTKDETKGVATDAKDLADETAAEVGSVLPEQEAAPAQTPPPPPSAVGAPPPPPSATEWHIDVGNGQTQVVKQSELAGLIQSGQVSKDTPVFTQALGSWQPAGEVAALRGYFAK